MQTSIKDQPLVSVIIPVFNREDVIERAIDSVLSQTYPQIEIIVVDDGSTDNTLAKVQKFGEKVQYISQKNSGPSAARNRGIKQAKGSYIAFLDSDDEWLPEKIEKQIRYATQNNLSAIITDSKILQKNVSQTTFGKSIFSGQLLSEKEQILNIFQMLVEQNFIHLSTVLIKKNVLSEAGLFDEKLFVAEDTDLWMRVAHKYEFGILNNVLAKRDVRDDKLSGNKGKEFSGRVYCFLKLLKEGELSGEEITIIRNQMYWVYGRLLSYNLSNKDFIEFSKALKMTPPGYLFSRNFYRGVKNQFKF